LGRFLTSVAYNLAPNSSQRLSVVLMSHWQDCWSKHTHIHMSAPPTSLKDLRCGSSPFRVPQDIPSSSRMWYLSSSIIFNIIFFMLARASLYVLGPPGSLGLFCSYDPFRLGHLDFCSLLRDVYVPWLLGTHGSFLTWPCFFHCS
jgi:hypothetical protein